MISSYLLLSLVKEATSAQMDSWGGKAGHLRSGSRTRLGIWEAGHGVENGEGVDFSRRE